MLIAAAVVVGAFGALTYVVPHCMKLRARSVLDRQCRERRVLVLTYDDGPTEDLTLELLAVLRSGSARATFFMTGARAGSLPHVVEAVARAGHEIGSHSARHVHPWRSMPWTSLLDLRDGLRALQGRLPARPLFRPPYGKITIFTWFAARFRGVRLGWWTMDSRDTHDDLPEVAEVVAEFVKRGGGVVLLHDMHSVESKGRGFVIDLTTQLIAAAARERITVRTLGEIA